MIQKVIDFDVTKKRRKNIIQIGQKVLTIQIGHPYKILRVGGSGSGKENALLILIDHEPDIDRISLYAKSPYEAKYQFLLNNRESSG